jgi:glycerol-3-phosphate acyltransferase PlsY
MSTMLSMPLLIALIFGYLLGSIPFGLLLTKAAGLGDVRTIGSGNIGATNVLRTGRKGLAAATLLLDGFKGTLAVLAAPVVISMFGLLPRSGTSVEFVRFIVHPMLAAGFGAFLGHLFPVWLGFKGGKGVATYIGVLLGFTWQTAAVFCSVWLLVAFATRYSSLAALTASLVAPLAFYWMGGGVFALVFAAMTLLLFWTHRENIARLINRTESKIGAKAAAATGG